MNTPKALLIDEFILLLNLLPHLHSLAVITFAEAPNDPILVPSATIICQ